MPDARSCLAMVVLSVAASTANARDTYANFAALARSERVGVDYRVSAVDRSSRILVLAIHAGEIERGSGEAARAIADADWSLYLFEAIGGGDPQRLHVTSAHFDEPKALALASHAGVCVSVHGMKGTSDRICLGGGNERLRHTLHEKLQAAGIARVEANCSALEGAAPSNIVNRCEEKGVQLELSRSLRDRIVSDPAVAATLAIAVRQAIAAYEAPR